MLHIVFEEVVLIGVLTDVSRTVLTAVDSEVISEIYEEFIRCFKKL